MVGRKEIHRMAVVVVAGGGVPKSVFAVVETRDNALFTLQHTHTFHQCAGGPGEKKARESQVRSPPWQEGQGQEGMVAKTGRMYVHFF